MNEFDRLLNDTKYYQKQSSDLTSKVQERVKEYTTRLHKENLIDYETLNYHLKPLLQIIPSFIKDTTHFPLQLQKLERLPDNALLVALDFSSLYTNIPHKVSIPAVIF